MRSRINVIRLSNVIFCLLLAVMFCWSSTICYAVDPPAGQIVRVEEDWRMVVDHPEPESVAPQVTCVISPVGNVNWVHAALTLNHRGLPEFQPGGVQLQVWNYENPLMTKNYHNTSVLSQDGELITWTQSMELKDGQLTFNVLNGNSATWGSFGDQDSLKASLSTALPDLNGYSPTVSVNNSGIGYASNRVHELVIQRIRLIYSTGEVYEDTTRRAVHEVEH